MRVKFYGIKCEAKISDTDFELIGKNKVTQKLLDLYTILIFFIVRNSSDSRFKIEILDPLEKD